MTGIKKNCDKCGAPIVLIKNDAGKWLPVQHVRYLYELNYDDADNEHLMVPKNGQFSYINHHEVCSANQD